MRTFKVDGNNCLVVENGNLVISKDIEVVKFSCEQAVKTQYGEMIFNIQGGIPYNTIAWGGVPNLTQLDAFLRKEILKVPEVTGITSLDISMSNHVISYDCVIKTTYGEVTLNDLRLSK